MQQADQNQGGNNPLNSKLLEAKTGNEKPPAIPRIFSKPFFGGKVDHESIKDIHDDPDTNPREDFEGK